MRAHNHRDVTRTAALVDIENAVIVGGRRLSAAAGSLLLNIIGNYTSGMPVCVATGENVLRAYLPVLAGLPWGLRLVNTEPDAADLALIEAGHDLIGCGVTDLVVISGDHAFAELAPGARLHVVSHAGHLSRQLWLAATTVRYLPTVDTAEWAQKAA